MSEADDELFGLKSSRTGEYLHSESADELFEDMGYEIAQAYFEFYKGIAKALTEKRKESEDKQ